MRLSIWTEFAIESMLLVAIMVCLASSEGAPHRLMVFALAGVGVLHALSFKRLRENLDAWGSIEQTEEDDDEDGDDDPDGGGPCQCYEYRIKSDYRHAW